MLRTAPTRQSSITKPSSSKSRRAPVEHAASSRRSNSKLRACQPPAHQSARRRSSPTVIPARRASDPDDQPPWCEDPRHMLACGLADAAGDGCGGMRPSDPGGSKGERRIARSRLRRDALSQMPAETIRQRCPVPARRRRPRAQIARMSSSGKPISTNASPVAVAARSRNVAVVGWIRIGDVDRRPSSTRRARPMIGRRGRGRGGRDPDANFSTHDGVARRPPRGRPPPPGCVGQDGWRPPRPWPPWARLHTTE